MFHLIGLMSEAEIVGLAIPRPACRWSKAELIANRWHIIRTCSPWLSTTLKLVETNQQLSPDISKVKIQPSRQFLKLHALGS